MDTNSLTVNPAPIVAKRRRGAQPGNSNARNNRGNRSAHGQRGNRGGGAPLGNQNARRDRPNPYELLLQEYGHIQEARAWIVLHSEQIRATFADAGRDPSLYSSYVGLTPEFLVDHRLEYRFGVYGKPDEDLFAAQRTSPAPEILNSNQHTQGHKDND